ncbi:MAG: glycosyltransferase [Vicinamibacterales bacterium]
MADVLEQPTASATARARVAFVIPVRNDAVRLANCLRTLAVGAGAIPHDVVVLDHGSTDGSAEVAEAAGARVIRHQGGNVAGLRNLGASSSSADLIAFVDADNEIVPGWLDAAIAAMADPKVGMAGAPSQAPPRGTWVQQTYDALRRHPKTTEPIEWLGAANMVVRRDVFLAIGGFDESLETCEDVDLCLKVMARGCTVLAVPGMKSVHHGDPARLGDVFWGELWRGRDNLRVSLRGPKSVRMVASALMPIAYAGAVVVALLGLVVGGVIGALASVVSLAGLGALLALRVTAMRRNAGGRWPAGLWAALQVAAVYDLGRSAAVFVGVGHGRRRGTPTA